MRVTWLAGILMTSSVLSAQDAKVSLLNPGFEANLDGWELAPGEPSAASVVSNAETGGQALKLTAQGENLGLNSAPVPIGEALHRDQTYRVSARLRFDGVEKGSAAFSVCAYDADDKRIAQYPVQHWSTRSSPHDWLTRASLIGPGTGKPFPTNAVSLRLRVSFYDREGDPAGTLWADDFSISEVTPPAAGDWPADIVVTAGDLQVRFESRSFWTLYRIDYQGDRLCKDQFGSHYGTVANVKNVGFIGSGHTENGETETVDALHLELDGRAIEQPAESATAETVVFRKHSRIRSLRLDTTVTVADNRILEEVSMTADEPIDLNLIYHFMHPWVVAMDQYAAQTDAGELVQGSFSGDKGMKVAAAVSWSAVYSTELGKGALTVVLDMPADIPWNVRYWDVPDRYRKHYLMTFANETVPAGRTFRYRVLTIPFATPEDAWIQQAQSIAGTILALQ